MAIFETWLKSDIKNMVSVTKLTGNMFSADNNGNLIGVEVMNNGEPAELDGVVTGYVIRPDGGTLIISGTLEENRASIILPASAYVYVGQISIVIKVGGTTVGACTGYVYRSTTDKIVDPGHVIPSLDELLQKIADCEAATVNANTAATSANNAASLANEKAALANTKAELADEKATLANEKAGLADDAATLANTKALLADEKATLANNKASLADEKAGLANDAAELASTNATLAGEKANLANAAATTANTAASKITNMTVSAYGLSPDQNPTVEITEVSGHKHITFGLVKGARGDSGKDFHIRRTFSSIAEMEAYDPDDDHTIYKVEEYDHVMIDTGSVQDPDTGKLYCYEPSTVEIWRYIGDLSGSQGIKGDPGNGISNIVLNQNYTLTITMDDGTTYTTPSVRGPQGETGATGATGETGDTGNGIDHVVLNADYTLTVYFTDSTSYTTDPIRGEQGATGNPGANAYVYIRYAAQQPTQDSDMKTVPDEWIGIYSGTSNTAPTTYTSYTWYKFKGETGIAENIYGTTVPMSPTDSTKVASAVQAAMTAASEKYTKPASGIPATDIADGVIPGVMTGSTAQAAGTAGLVPAPAAGDQNKALFGDGTWKIVNTNVYGDEIPMSETDETTVSEAIDAVEAKIPFMPEPVSGDIATFTDVIGGMPLGLTVGIEPVQDLHGYDHPWPAGGGKNKINYLSCVGIGARNGTDSVYGNNTSISGTELTITQAYGGNGWILKGVGTFPLSTGEYVTISGKATLTGTSNLVVGISNYDGGGTNNINSGVTVTNGRFSVTLDAKSDYAKTGIFLQPQNVGSTAVVSEVMVALGQTEQPYAPYSNICPISGWTGAEVSRTGVNVWDEEWESGIINDSGDQPQGNSIRSKNYNICKPSTEYYKYQGTGFSGYPVIVWYDSNKNLISRNTSSYQLCTSPANARYFRISMYNYGTTYNHDVSINYPSSDTQYHPGQVEQISYPFPSEAGTVYGGTLTVHQDGTGTLVVDRFSKSLAVADMNNSENYPGWNYSNTEYGEWVKNIAWDKQKLSSIGPHPSRNITGSNRILYYVPGSSSHPNLKQSEWKSTYPDLVIQIVDYLATPVTYELTALEVIATLKGTNNIWADTGSIISAQSGVDVTGATATSSGTHGFVPAPSAGDQTKVLTGDGTWRESPGAKVYEKTVTITNTSGAYSETFQDENISAEMKAVELEVNRSYVFGDSIIVTPGDGYVTVECSDMAGTDTIKISLIKVIDDPTAITSTEFTILNNRIGNLASLETTDKTSVVNAVNEVAEGVATNSQAIENLSPSGYSTSGITVSSGVSITQGGYFMIGTVCVVMMVLSNTSAIAQYGQLFTGLPKSKGLSGGGNPVNAGTASVALENTSAGVRAFASSQISANSTIRIFTVYIAD